jgi:hypothetical protein
MSNQIMQDDTAIVRVTPETVMRLTNKDMRETFIRAFRPDKPWIDIPALDLRFTRLVFPDGTQVVTEWTKWAHPIDHTKTWMPAHHIIKPGEPFNRYPNSVTNVVEMLTEMRKKIAKEGK